MKQDVALNVASVISVLLMTIHLADDIARGMEKGDTSNLLAVPLLVTWLYGTLVLAERRSGYVITMLGSLLGLSVPAIHFMASGGVLAGEVAEARGALLFVWTLVALGVTSAFSVVLSTRGLWRLTWGRPRSTEAPVPSENHRST